MNEIRPGDPVEIESREELHAHVDAHGSLESVVVQGLDLRADGPLLRRVSTDGTCFLGCRMSSAAEAAVRADGGTIFPAFSDLPFRPYRSSLYTPEELIDGYDPDDPEPLSRTVDHRIYSYYRTRREAERHVPVLDALAFRIHDHAIDDALRDLLHPTDGPPRRVVGIMGGHALRRDDSTYRSVARLAHQLARNGFFVTTGGGPGAMEAANLGASFASRPASAVDDAIRSLSDAPHYTDPGYIEAALSIRRDDADRCESLAVPTWFYGHEPSNLFSTHIAKYFANSIREDGLLAIATCGVVFAPGSAGTIQEVFMDAAQNHYETFGPASPMVFFDRTYWTETKPVFPLLRQLAADAPHADHLTAMDDVDGIVETLERYAAARFAPAD
jgi:predicted Rossmann-fold nucleotide-binding protein